MHEPFRAGGLRSLRCFDALVAVWVLAWVAMGVWVGVDVHHLGRLADTLGTASVALRDTANGLKDLSGVPLVGGALSKLAGSAAATALSASTNAGSAKTSVDQLAYLLGAVIIVLPSAPLLAAYLPFRLGRAREIGAVRSALAGRTNNDNLRRYLANRALANLAFHRLLAISDDPWRDVQEGHLDALAGAELARLGLDSHALDRPVSSPRSVRSTSS